MVEAVEEVNHDEQIQRVMDTWACLQGGVERIEPGLEVRAQRGGRSP